MNKYKISFRCCHCGNEWNEVFPTSIKISTFSECYNVVKNVGGLNYLMRCPHCRRTFEDIVGRKPIEEIKKCIKKAN